MAIATVLAMEPAILVMDEPSSGLDPRARRRLIGLLRSFEHTRIVATHDLDLAAELCERTIVMSDGKVVADGPTRRDLRRRRAARGERPRAAARDARLPGVRARQGGSGLA